MTREMLVDELAKALAAVEFVFIDEHGEQELTIPGGMLSYAASDILDALDRTGLKVSRA